MSTVYLLLLQTCGVFDIFPNIEFAYRGRHALRFNINSI